MTAFLSCSPRRHLHSWAWTCLPSSAVGTQRRGSVVSAAVMLGAKLSRGPRRTFRQEAWLRRILKYYSFHSKECGCLCSLSLLFPSAAVVHRFASCLTVTKESSPWRLKDLTSSTFLFKHDNQNTQVVLEKKDDDHVGVLGLAKSVTRREWRRSERGRWEKSISSG